jgi:hypothetical protein
MKITREFCPGDRYVYDFGLCTCANQEDDMFATAICIGKDH